jgi:hypothetical protein
MNAPKRQRTVSVSVTLEDGSVVHDAGWDMFVAKDALSAAVEKKIAENEAARVCAAEVETKKKAADDAYARMLQHVQTVFPNAVKVEWDQSGDLEYPDMAQYYEGSRHNLAEEFDLEYRLEFFIGFATPEDPTCDANEAALRLTYDATLKTEATDEKVYFELDAYDFSLNIDGWQTDTVNPSADAVRRMLIKLVTDEAPETPASLVCEKLKACNIAKKLAACSRFVQ